MLPRSGRVGTIHTSAAEARDRSRAAYGTFYATIALPGLVYQTLAGQGLKAVGEKVWPHATRDCTSPTTLSTTRSLGRRVGTARVRGASVRVTVVTRETNRMESCCS